MPRLAALCSHRLVDVSSFAELARRWHPAAFYCAPAKQNAHEALKDVSDSIDELKYWKQVMFKSAHEVTKAVARAGNARRGG
jgi:oligoribonuclease